MIVGMFITIESEINSVLNSPNLKLPGFPFQKMSKTLLLSEQSFSESFLLDNNSLFYPQQISSFCLQSFLSDRCRSVPLKVMFFIVIRLEIKNLNS